MAEQVAVPEDLHYTKDHEWVRIEGDLAVVGITDHAQHALGEITYVEPPPAGKALKQFAEAGAVESAKAASDIFSPLSGVVAEVNSALETEPNKINSQPYGEGWIYKLKGAPSAELGSLLTAQQYRALIQEPQP
jgi:glycine cleavage system H protein